MSRPVCPDISLTLGLNLPTSNPQGYPWTRFDPESEAEALARSLGYEVVYLDFDEEITLQ